VYESEWEGTARTAARHLKILGRYRSRGRLLDVGCAMGLFLKSASETGWEVVGVEPARGLCDKARELVGHRGEVICATLQEANLPAASFDAVTLWDVLEHVSDPLVFARSCAALLRPGGLLLLNVPDLDSWQARLLGTRWPLLLPEHLNYFNRRSLRLCGERAALAWVSFLRRNVSFSVEYALYRMAQHDIPGTVWGHRLTRGSLVGRASVPLPLGELCGVWRKREAADAREVTE
jgi:SAM-dependent methyltransferase